MEKIIDLEKHIAGIKNSISIMEEFAQVVQDILDRDYSKLELKAIDTYARPYIHPQVTVCVFKKEDFDSANPCDIVFSIHFKEDRKSLDDIINKRITESKRWIGV